ncbi:MAG: translation initiation factor IF-2, partial [Nanoarchaeota archaeon]
LGSPIETRVKALLEPLPLKEMRDKKTKFRAVNEVIAATGVKISAPEIDDVIAGMPLQSYTDETKEKVMQEIRAEVGEVIVETESSGIIIKADTLGSLEALTFLLKEKNISVRKAGIGKISKKDLADAESNYDKEPLEAVILGFNVLRDADIAGNEKVKIITGDIIYRIIDELGEWQKQQTDILEAKALDNLIRPCKIQLLTGYVFRQSNPAIIGVDIIEGNLSTGTSLMKSGTAITIVKEIQHEKENLKSITKGKQAALSLDKVTVGRQIKEGDILYSYIPQDDFREIKKLMKFLSKGEIDVLKEIAEIMRKVNPVWGV